MTRKNLVKTKSYAMVVAMTALMALSGCKGDTPVDTTVEESTVSSTEISSTEEASETTTVEVSTEEIPSDGTSTTEATEVETESSTEEISTEYATEEITTEEVTTEESSESSSTEKETEPETATKETVKETEKQTEVSSQATVSKVTATYSGGTKYVGDTVSANEVTVKVTMSDGSTLTNPAGWSMNTSQKLVEGTNSLTVTYQGVSTTLKVTAVKRPVEQPTQPPVQPTEPSTGGATEVTISYIDVFQESKVTVYGGVVMHPKDLNITLRVEYSDGYVLRINGNKYLDCNGTNPTYQWLDLPSGKGLTYSINEFCIDYGETITFNVSYDGITAPITLTADAGFSRALSLQAFDELNKFRAQNGLKPMVWDEDMYYYSAARAAEWATNTGAGHDGNWLPGGNGENLAYNYRVDAAYVIDQWANSAGHRENMLRGISAVTGEEGTLYAAIGCFVGGFGAGNETMFWCFNFTPQPLMQQLQQHGMVDRYHAYVAAAFTLEE